MLGEDVRSCAVHLRIREPYLRAIEDSRFEDLPGRAYAVGFVRAYAIHLGLDGDKVVDRFKSESNDNEATPQLVVPEPTPESGMPGGSLLAASVLLAVLAYGGWYYISTHSRLVTEAPAIDLPTRPAPVAPQLAARPTIPAQAVPPAISLTGQATSMQGPILAAPAPRPGALPAVAPSGLMPAQPAASAQPASAADDPTVSAAASEDADEAEAPPAPEPLRPATAVAAAQTSVPPAAGTADTAIRDAVARPPISASSAIAATISDAQRPGSGPSRVVIRAIADSWLQVGDGRGPALFAQVLRAGDSYHVPDRPGLRFDTGNAGGLEITVDGRPVPSVGPSGSVRRNIPLDADKLVAGAFGQR
jgi:cytoskeleton protein RodZ